MNLADITLDMLKVQEWKLLKDVSKSDLTASAVISAVLHPTNKFFLTDGMKGPTIFSASP